MALEQPCLSRHIGIHRLQGGSEPGVGHDAVQRDPTFAAAGNQHGGIREWDGPHDPGNTGLDGASFRRQQGVNGGVAGFSFRFVLTLHREVDGVAQLVQKSAAGRRDLRSRLDAAG